MISTCITMHLAIYLRSVSLQVTEKRDSHVSVTVPSSDSSDDDEPDEPLEPEHSQRLPRETIKVT